MISDKEMRKRIADMSPEELLKASETFEALFDLVHQHDDNSIANTNSDYYKGGAGLIVKRCPFCGIPPKVWSYGEKKLTRCLTDGCPMAEAELDVYLDAWNNRPEEQRLFEVIKNKQMIIDGGKHMGETVNPNIGKKVWFTKKSVNARGDIYATDRVIGELVGLFELKALVKDDFGQVFIVPADDLKFCEL